MIKDNLHTYYLKIKTLSPIHIGTGEAYEPTNFVIDNGKLYQFDEVLFYQSLNLADKNLFLRKLNNWMSIIDFYRSKVQEAKAVSAFECNVSKKVENTYKKIRNNDGSKKKNQFQIAQTFKNPNTYRAIIAGSSLKGMLDTVLGIYPQKIDSNELRQKLILSDAILLDGKTEIGYAYRKHKNPTKTASSEIPQMVEIISKDSTFIFTITTKYSLKFIKEKMQAYHNDRANSIYNQTSNSFVARVGKFSGKEYMVDDGKNVLNSYGKPIATHTLYESGDTFGWIDIEEIDKYEFHNALNSIATKEKEYYDHIEEKQRSIIEKISLQKEKAKEEAIKRQEVRDKEERKKAEAVAKREAELAQMSPLEKKLDELVENDKANTPKTTLILNALKNNYFEDSDRLEALNVLKKLLIQEKKWKEKSTAKKPEKDKSYQQTLLVKKMISESK